MGMTENEAIEVGKSLYENITLKGNNIIPVAKYIEFVRMAIKALEEIQQYRAIGTVEQLEWCKDASHWKELFKDKLEQYEAIGTIEEFKALKDEQQNKCKDCAGCTIWKCDCANERVYAIDEFVNAVKEIFPNDKNGIANIEIIAEQLKAGGTDGNK